MFKTKTVRQVFIPFLMLCVGLSGLVLMSAGGEREKAVDQELTGAIRVAGSSTVFPVTAAIAEEFNRMHPEVQIPIQSTGTGGGFSNFFIPGKTCINNASRRIKESEMQAAQEQGINPVEFTVATDAITVVVNPEADWVDSITTEELARIWGPENPARSWSDVQEDWPDEELALYGPTSASGTFDYFTEEIMGMEDAHRSDYQGTEQDNTIIQAVSGSPYAMGYLGLSYYLENQDKVKALAVNGVKPGIQTAKTGEYKPLSRPLFIYVARECLDDPAVRQFLRFYLEQTSTDLIKEVGYVPLTEEEKEQQLARLEDAVKAAEAGAPSLPEAGTAD
jgi:phosphate transport system substrate-binding protein